MVPKWGDPDEVSVSVDGTPARGSATRAFVVGSPVALSAPATAQVGRRLWAFAGWSDGGPREHVVTAPSTARGYVASYDAVRARLRISTARPGLELRVQGKTHTSGWRKSCRVGAKVRVEAPRQQWLDGHLFEFVGWSDGKGRRHSVVMPGGGIDLRAVYRQLR